jgi:ATP-dependent DNA helicase PIF1
MHYYCITYLGTHIGQRVFIPRITLIPSDTDLPFELRRRQFPIRVAFAMTINKAQSQTLDFVGIYLPEPVFTHGQLYVALSRVASADRTKVFVKNGHLKGNKGTYTRNVVFSEVLSR